MANSGLAFIYLLSQETKREREEDSVPCTFLASPDHNMCEAFLFAVSYAGIREEFLP